MGNYLNLLNDYDVEKDNLMCFNSYSNDVRFFKDHVIKTFNNRSRLERCILGLKTISNTSVCVPTLQFVDFEKNIIIENYISGMVLNEYVIHLTKKMLFDIGQLMGRFHNLYVSDCDNENSWISFILSDMKNIRHSLALYKDDFIESFNFVEKETKNIFKNTYFTYVHGDFRPANIILNNIDEKYFLIDFENFSIGDPTVDIYKMLSIFKSFCNYNKKDVCSFLDGYSSVRSLPDNLIKKWFFYDCYYSLRSVRRAINDGRFRNVNDIYISNADKSAQRQNSETHILSDWIELYLNNLH